MLGQRNRRVADLCLAGFLLYASFWVYELANLLVLSSNGNQTSISISDLLPLGTASISDSSTSMLYSKVLQVAACTGVVAVSAVLAMRVNLKITALAGLSVIASYLASFYWEALSFSSPSDPLHVLTFLGVAGVVNGAMLFLVLRSRYLPDGFRSRRQISKTIMEPD